MKHAFFRDVPHGDEVFYLQGLANQLGYRISLQDMRSVWESHSDEQCCNWAEIDKAFVLLELPRAIEKYCDIVK